MKKILALFLVFVLAISMVACSNEQKPENSELENTSNTTNNNSNTVDVPADLTVSDGLEFESNGDGTCTLVGIGICNDSDIVIPTKSPDGDTVTLIKEYAFMSLEDVESVTILNYNYEVDERAFQYGDMTSISIIGGKPVIGESAFSSCEKVISLVFKDCELDIDEYAFLSCGKKATVNFENCKGVLNDRAFQYGDFTSITINGCTFEIGESTFSSCEELTSVIFKNSTLELGEYAFLSCGDSAQLSIEDCSIGMDDRAFQYSSLSEVKISGDKVEIGNSTFSSCENLTSVQIDSKSVTLGEYAFMSCEDLTSVSICDNGNNDNTISLDDRVFQYCESLSSVKIGSGTVEIGTYCFSSCADNLIISVAGKTYNAKQLEKGI